MTVPESWEEEKQEHAAQLYAALVALVGDVPALYRTSASLSWRSASGIQGHWRAVQDQVWLGRIVPFALEEVASEQLALALARVQEDETPLGLAHPVLYTRRTGEGVVTSYDRETPESYAAAVTLVMQLLADVQGMLAHLGTIPAAPLETP